MHAPRLKLALGTLAAALLPAVASAQTIITSPGVVTHSGAPRYSDPVVPGAWLRENVGGAGATASVGINNAYPRNGNGSAYMAFTQAPGTSSGKADFEYLFTRSPIALSDVNGASFDVLRAGSSTVAAYQNPALRFYVDADGNTATTTDRGYLIWEGVNNGQMSLPADTWVTNTIGGSSNLWFRQFTGGFNDYSASGIGRSLASYQAGGYTPTGGATVVLNGNSVIYGLSTGIGSGWTPGGSWEGAVDDVTLDWANDEMSFNFETAATPVPEPATFALLGGGLLAIGGIASRRRKTQA